MHAMLRFALYYHPGHLYQYMTTNKPELASQEGRFCDDSFIELLDGVAVRWAPPQTEQPCRPATNQPTDGGRSFVASFLAKGDFPNDSWCREAGHTTPEVGWLNPSPKESC